MPASPHPSVLPRLADLAVLAAVGAHGGIGAAARALGMAQPNASRSLARLEARYGLDLVSRGARGSSLTDDGALLVDWAREVLRAVERFDTGAATLRRGPQGTLRVAASQTIAEALLPRWLAALRADRPDVRVSLEVGNSEEVGTLVSRGDTLGLVESPDLPRTLAVPVAHALITTDRLAVVVAPGHEWLRRTRPVDVAELRTTPLVVREPGSGTRVALENALGPGMAPPSLELASNAAVRLAVASGAAPAVLSEHAVREAVASGELRVAMVDGLVAERPLRAVWAEDGSVPEAGARLVELAVEAERARAPGAAQAQAFIGWGL